ncbi:Hypothetical predicted protein, partial [Drosophila guanche]
NDSKIELMLMLMLMVMSHRLCAKWRPTAVCASQPQEGRGQKKKEMRMRMRMKRRPGKKANIDRIGRFETPLKWFLISARRAKNTNRRGWGMGNGYGEWKLQWQTLPHITSCHCPLPAASASLQQQQLPPSASAATWGRRVGLKLKLKLHLLPAHANQQSLPDKVANRLVWICAYISKQQLNGAGGPQTQPQPQPQKQTQLRCCMTILPNASTDCDCDWDWDWDSDSDSDTDSSCSLCRGLCLWWLCHLLVLRWRLCLCATTELPRRETCFLSASLQLQEAVCNGNDRDCGREADNSQQ